MIGQIQQTKRIKRMKTYKELVAKLNEKEDDKKEDEKKEDEKKEKSSDDNDEDDEEDE